jgi:acyl-CoA hydrolase
VVTEHGVAGLRDKSVDERAEALIAIADPAFRCDLADAWQALRRKAAS